MATHCGGLRPFLKLHSDESRREAAKRILDGCKTAQKLEEIVNAVHKNWLVAMHWREGNPHIPATKVQDTRARDNWAARVPPAAIAFRSGRWKPEPGRPWPTWDLILKQCLLYTDPSYEYLLELMRRPVMYPSLVESGTTNVLVYEYGQKQLRIFQEGSNVPSGVAGAKVLLVLAEATLLKQASFLAQASLINGGLVAVFGPPPQVECYAQKLENLHISTRKVDVAYYVKGGTTVGDNLASNLRLRLIGNVDLFKAKVWILSTVVL